MIDENSTKAEVLEAVKKDGLDLRFASKELRNDREVVLEAIRQNVYAFAYCGLQDDREVALEVAKLDWWQLKWTSKAFRADRDFFVKAAKSLSDDVLYDILTRFLGTGSLWQ